MRLELLLPALAALLATVLPPRAAPPASPVPPVPRPSATVWPVGVRPAIARAWDPPATPYGAGHRGVDLTAPPGGPVRAVAAGRIAFAGRVAGRGVVSVELDGTGDPPLRTTYEPVRGSASLKKGARVAAGEVVGTLEFPTGHCPGSCLHWGLRRAEAYLDPLSLLPPRLLHHGPSRLLPVHTGGGGLSPGRPAAPWPPPPR